MASVMVHPTRAPDKTLDKAISGDIFIDSMEGVFIVQRIVADGSTSFMWGVYFVNTKALVLYANTTIMAMQYPGARLFNGKVTLVQ